MNKEQPGHLFVWAVFVSNTGSVENHQSKTERRKINCWQLIHKKGTIILKPLSAFKYLDSSLVRLNS